MSPFTARTALKYDCLPEAWHSGEIDRWRDEGGTGAPSRRRAPKGSAAAVPRNSPRDPGDTAEGCRERAAADLLRSVSMIIANERRRMESSAASWAVRAELLGRIEASAAARQANAPGLST